jgi:antitoxin CcdA
MLRMFQEGPMPQTTTEKQRTNVTLTAANLAAARELGLNVSAISDAAVAEAVRAAKAEAWAKENAGAIAERRAWIEANGTPLADLQVLKLS